MTVDMRLAATAKAVGLTLARDLPSQPGRVPLLREGAQISEGLARALTDRHGIHAVWVDDELSEGIEPDELIPADLRSEAALTVARSLEAAAECSVHNSSLPQDIVDDLAAMVGKVVDALLDQPSAAMALFDLAAADEYTHQHSVDVMALGLLLGREHLRRNGWTDWTGRRRFDGLDSKLTQFGLGLVLHDIGKAAIPREVLTKPGPLTDEEWEAMRAHPKSGSAILPSSLSFIALATIRQHHERWDGSGYPDGLVGEEINQLARVAAVADVYDAVTSQRPYKAAASPREAVDLIIAGAGTSFDPAVVETFRRVVFPHPVGSEVTLPDGRVGVVCAVDPARPEVPMVRVPDGDGHAEVAVDLRDGLVTA